MLVSLFNKVGGLQACNFIKKRLGSFQRQVFSCGHGNIFKSIYSEEHLRTTASVFLKSKLQIMLFTHEPKTSFLTLEFTKYFLYYSPLKTLVPANLCLLLRLSRILNISNVSFSSSLNRLNTFNHYQKCVPTGNEQSLTDFT